MNKKILISLPGVFSITSYQRSYAHNDNNDSLKQEASDDWADFMSVIKKQEVKVNADKEIDKSNSTISNT